MFEIRRVDRRVKIDFEVWESGQSRPSIDVEVWKPEEDLQEQAEVSWPSTSDRRPALALALAEALKQAVEEANDLQERFDIMMGR